MGYDSFMPLGPWEIVLLVFVVLLFFGAKRLPEMGRSLGSGMREFKHGLTSSARDDDPERRDLEPGETRVKASAGPR